MISYIILSKTAQLLFTLQCLWAMAVHRCPGRVGFPWASRAVGFLIRRSRPRRSGTTTTRLFSVDYTTSGREKTGWRGVRGRPISISGGRWISARRWRLRWLQLKGDWPIISGWRRTSLLTVETAWSFETWWRRTRRRYAECQCK